MLLLKASIQHLLNEFLTGLTGLPPFSCPLAKEYRGDLLYHAKYTVGTIPAPRDLDAQ
jgi:hypothetical protein